MAGDARKGQPIIVRRVTRGKQAAHGNANWKIAYADFVTAMMAFFLLMWLLGSTSQAQLQGIADYFNQPLKVSPSGGEGSGTSASIVTGGGRDLTSEMPLDLIERRAMEMADGERQRRDRERIDALYRQVQGLMADNPVLAEYGSQIRIERIEDGLLIQIFDAQNRPMFDTGSALVKPYMRDILREIGTSLAGVENRIVLSGHTDAAPYGSGERGYSNWELSADRANASRRELVAAGLPADKLVRVEGLAASRPADARDPYAPANRRISVLVMTEEAERRMVPLATEPAVASRGPIALPDLQKAAETPKPREALRAGDP
jgi:chemotaxis protein MotB